MDSRYALSMCSTLGAALALACVPPGNAPPFDGGVTSTATAATAKKPPERPALASPPLTSVFEDNFERAAAQAAGGAADASAASSATAVTGDAGKDGGKDAGKEVVAQIDAGAATSAVPIARGEGALGPDWILAGGTTAWRIENGRLCGRNARNKGVWLNRTLPVNARIEFDAISDSPEGDIKAEVWGDGQSGATTVSYTNATSYLVIFGGWQNKFHVLARINEHGTDRKEIEVKASTDEFRERAVAQGQVYRFKVERSDGKTVRWWVNDTEMLAFEDRQPLVGATHDHFGFNNWQVRVCFDNVKVTPLSAL